MLGRKSGMQLTVIALAILAVTVLTGFEANGIHAGSAELQEWLLPDEPPAPANNQTTPERAALGKMLFFDSRLSRDGRVSCASCHSPLYGWSDGLPTGVGIGGAVLGRASPTIVNVGFNSIQMWDGREPTLESQASGPMKTAAEMHTDLSMVVAWLRETPGYVSAFAAAYPDEPISMDTVTRALAAFERTVISNNSPFDQWVAGDAGAMNPQEIEGFKVFLDPDKGNCAVCHSAPNFTDNGFHNLGLASFGLDDPDPGRYSQVPLRLMQGAFKTPTLRDIALTAPYFHDGSATTLMEVIEHYEKGGEVTSNLSPNMKPLSLTQADKEALVAFMQALTSPPEPFVLPVVPPEPFPVVRQADAPAAELASR